MRISFLFFGQTHNPPGEGRAILDCRVEPMTRDSLGALLAEAWLEMICVGLAAQLHENFDTFKKI